MKKILRRILSESVHLHVSPDTLSDEADLYAAGLESIATVHLMLAIEENFDVAIPDEMLNRKSFSSINSMADAISRLQKQKVTS
ncbi:Aminoacyl carrier protein [Paraburkholderia ribeironis]|uniref:Aminoacyl carrier protein n=1 Tax=Paraburkholderia ribeironis TaxID=1247936 RepID=A0A1N7SPV5_9BURK|nr:acyl carrier protein [Paraburkholderia ribeironis]SIT49464.1 Aminoacyl carrier protein [Paraburkholderia ribeironis]